MAAEEPTAGWPLSLEYNADLFDAATVDRLLARFGTLLGGIVAGPGRPLVRPAAAARGRAPPRAARLERDRRRFPELGLHPRALRGPGRADARRGRRRLRGPRADLPRARRPSEPAGQPPEGPGRRRRVAGRPSCMERSAEMVVGAAGRPQGRRRLRAARPRVPRRAPRLHARRRPRRRRADAGPPPRPAARRRRRGSSASTTTGRRSPPGAATPSTWPRRPTTWRT